MKYIKTFENKIFKEGDYVVLKQMSNRDLIDRGFPADDIEEDYSGRELFVKLIPTPSIWKDGVKQNWNMKLMDYLEKRNKPYTGKFSDIKHIIKIYKTDIVRKMTEQEISKFDLESDLKKYNL